LPATGRFGEGIGVRYGRFAEATVAKTIGQLAKESGIGVSTIGFAKSVLNHSEPNIIAMVDSGEVRVGVAVGRFWLFHS
jgi:hypothetical protein